ncbi:MAG: hypothetical protein LQ348_004984 [Seirophora lacunosa]|nr:MAG: hypothetical protein LQ348_004984 [Seirophora lacunosa]
MPSTTDRTRRYSRHSHASQKPSPAVLRSSSPIEVKKSSNASKAQLRPTRRQGAISIPKSTPKSSPTAETSTKSIGKAHIDVFAFMDNTDTTDEGENTQHTDDEHEDDKPIDSTAAESPISSPLSARHPSSHYSDLEVSVAQQPKRQTWHGGFSQAGSFHSDSGISMGSSSGDAGSPVVQHKYPTIRPASLHQAPIPEDNGLNVSCEPCESLPMQRPTFAADPWPQLTATPEAYYARVPHEAPQGLDDSTFQLPVTPPELSPQFQRDRKQIPAKEPRPKHGYSQLASEISSQEDAVLKPVYRKFETLNNRILLYLQDEISELEADLEELDAAITQEAQCVGRTGYPASRRAEARTPGPRQWQRNHLLERCANKIDYYNRTLTSYSNLAQTLSPSSSSEINAYRSWITKHNPIAKPETSFLRKHNDLITVSQGRQYSRLPTSLAYPPVTVTLTILTTIIVFKFVPQFFARLVVSAVIGLVYLASPRSLWDLQSLKENKKGAGIYAAVMLMLALVVD